MIWHLIQHWLAVHTGTVNEPGDYYGFWSGFGSDIGEVAIVGGLLSIYRHHNCHVQGCLRLSRAPVTGTPWKTCWRHHPEGKPPTHGHILADHRAHKERLAVTRRDTP